MPGLDLLRAVAALLVMMFHLTYWTWLDQTSQGLPLAFRVLQPIASRGWVGVQIFFVLSGFVIAYSMEGLSAARFVRHRVERLVPAAAFCASLTFVVLLLFSHESQLGGRWLRSVVFWPAGPWIDGSYWTLPIEVSFYVLMALVLLGGRTHLFAPVLFLLGAGSTLCDVLLLSRPGWLPTKAYLQLGRCWFPPYACELLVYGSFFALGSFLYLFLLREQSVLHFTGALIASVGCVSEVLWHDRGLLFANPPRAGGWGSVALWVGAVVVLIGSVVLSSRSVASMGPRVRRVIRLAGLTTYPLYLLHAQIGEWLVHGLYRRVGAVPALVCAVAAVLGAALFVTLVVEPRLRGLLRRGLDRLPSRAALWSA